MKNVALITGASSGLGKEFALIHAEKGGDLVLVARREPLLQSLKKEIESAFKSKVLVVAKDLSLASAAGELYSLVKEQGIEINYLINNAGFGGVGKFHEREWAADQSMINLNIMALTELTRLFLPEMVKRNRGRILNVASTAGFMPGPLQATYFATKAFVRSFSMALTEELSDTNVTVTLLSPGPTKTEFEKVANLEGTDLFKGNIQPAAFVARKGYDAMEKGSREIISDAKMAFGLKFIVPFVPISQVLKMTRKMQEKKV